MSATADAPTLPGLADRTHFQVAYQTRTGSLEHGPLAVLWMLIEGYEVDIFSVSLARITRDFLAHITAAEISLEEKADFSHTAARLIFYKSRQLLPNAAIGEDTPPDTLPFELVEQLLEYKKMQQAAIAMRDLEERSQLRITRLPSWQAFEDGGEYLEVDLLSFLKAFRDFLEREEKSRPLTITDESVSVPEMVEYLKSKLVTGDEASFFRAITGLTLIRIVVGFLALLEMAKQKWIKLRQDTWLGDIHFAALVEHGQMRLEFEEAAAPGELTK